jgi:hypothetical protein
MANMIDLLKFAVQVVGVHTPGNWDRPLGYDGTARFVAVYWNQAGNDVFITDGISGATAGAWRLYTDLIEHEAREEINAALMACGAQPKNALGNSDHEAACALILDRFENCLWVGCINETIRFLSKQHKRGLTDADHLRSALDGQRKEVFDEANVRPTIPCHCAQGWILSDGNYVPCSDCYCTGRIEVISPIVVP